MLLAIRGRHAAGFVLLGAVALALGLGLPPRRPEPVSPPREASEERLQAALEPPSRPESARVTMTAVGARGPTPPATEGRGERSSFARASGADGRASPSAFSSRRSALVGLLDEGDEPSFDTASADPDVAVRREGDRLVADLQGAQPAKVLWVERGAGAVGEGSILDWPETGIPLRAVVVHAGSGTDRTAARFSPAIL